MLLTGRQADRQTGRQADRQTRNIYLDIVKFFTIFLVVWGHVVQQTSNLSCWPVQGDGLMRFIYTMHMPLFMGLCGYFFYLSLKKQASSLSYLKNKLGSRLLGLLIPMLSFGLLKIICDIFWGHAIPNSTLLFIKYWLNAAKGIWFLGDVAVNTVIVLFIYFWCNGRLKHDLVLLALGTLLSMVPYFTYLSPHMYFFFIIGFCVAAYVKTGFLQYIKYWKIPFALFLVAYWLFSNMPWPPEDFFFNMQKSISQLIINDGLKLLLGLLGSYLFLVGVYRILPLISKSSIYRLAIAEGKNTMNFYLLQIIIVEKILGPTYKHVMSFYGWDWINPYGLIFKSISTFFISVVIFSLVIGANRLCTKNGMLSKVLFYK